MLSVLLRLLSDRRPAEDLLHEAFLWVFLRREAYRPPAAFRTWLFTIARDLLIDCFRKAHGNTAVNDTEARPTVPSPLERAEARELPSGSRRRSGGFPSPSARCCC